MIQPPPEHAVSIVRSPESIVKVADFYDKSPKEIKKTNNVHLRIIGQIRQNVVSAARTNAISERFAVLGGVSTLPDYRCRGFSKSVVSKWTEVILNQNVHPILDVDQNNDPAKSVYKAIGYKEVGKQLYLENKVSLISQLRFQG